MNIRDIDTEKLLALTLIGIAGYMLVEASSFQGNVSTFPRITASVVIIGSLLVLIKNHLPDPLRKAVADTSALIEADDEKIETLDEQRNESTEPRNLEDEPFHLRYRPVITFVLLTVYVLASYLIGFLLASPLFVAAYTLIMRQPWYIVLTTSILSFLIVYAFMVVLNIPVDDGLLFEGVPW